MLAISANFEWSWRTWARFRHLRRSLIWPEFGQIHQACLASAKLGPNSTKIARPNWARHFDQVGPRFIKHCPQSANIGPASTKIVLNSANYASHSTKYWPNSTKHAPRTTNLVRACKPKSGQIWASRPPGTVMFFGTLAEHRGVGGVQHVLYARGPDVDQVREISGNAVAIVADTQSHCFLGEISVLTAQL